MSSTHCHAKSSKPFARSKASTIEKIKVKTLTKGPSQVYDEVFEEAGGMIAFECLADIRKGRKKEENLKWMNCTILLRSQRPRVSHISEEYSKPLSLLVFWQRKKR